MLEMFKAKINSPQTELASSITAIQTTITVVNAAVLPAAPNICTIGVDTAAETIMYSAINGNQLTGVTRGFQGVAAAWGISTLVGRYYTAYDHDTFVDNLIAINGVKTAIILSDAWVGASAPYTQEIAVTGILDTYTPSIAPLYDGANLALAISQKTAWNMIDRIITFNGGLVATCLTSKPTTSINVQIKGF